MLFNTRLVEVAVVGIAALTAGADAQCQQLTSTRSATLASGITSKLVASGLTRPRGIMFDSAGNLLVVEQRVGIKRLKLTESGSTICVSETKTLIANTALNHGIEFTADGKTLLASSQDNVYAWTYDAAAGTVGTSKTIIANMTQGGHNTRTLLRSKFQPDILLVARGSDGNVDNKTTTKDGGRSMIKLFNLTQVLAASSPYNYNTQGEVYGWGLRNSVGLTEHPITGGIWSVENSLDNAAIGGKDVHNNNPAEELNYHGALNDTANTLRGANYGYPSCFSAWVPGDVGLTAAGQQFIPDGVPKPASGSCTGVIAPRIAFPAHTAPLDVKFTADGKTAYVTFHGSWNRDPPDGYRLMKIPFGADGQPTANASSTTATTSVMANSNNSACPNSCFRPVGLTWDSKGRLFMSSDTSGEIYLIGGA